VTGPTDRRGTEVHFMASTQTFGRIEYHYDILAKRIHERALNNGTKIELIDQRDGKSENFAYSGAFAASSSTDRRRCCIPRSSTRSA
jgi:DNA gyrase subunit B